MKNTQDDTAQVVHLQRLIRELRVWCKKEAVAARRDGKARGFSDTNRARDFGRMDAMEWAVEEIDRRFGKLPNNHA